MRLEASFAKLLLQGGKLWDWDYSDVESLDPDFYRHKVKYVLENDVSYLDLDFTDALDDRGAELEEPLRDEDGSKQDGEEEWYREYQQKVNPAPQEKERALRILKEKAAKEDDKNKAQKAAQKRRLLRSERVVLREGGEDELVTEANKEEYVRLVCERRLYGSILPQVARVLKGLHTVVTPEVLECFASMASPGEFTDLIGGLTAIDVVDWHQHTRYTGGYTPDCQTIKWFWDAVRSFTPDQQGLVLQFGTGSRFTPVGGYAHLQGYNGGLHLFTVCKAVHATQNDLPTAHACICTVDIPEYGSYEVLRSKLLTAISMGSTGFDDPAVTDFDAASESDVGP